MLNSRTKINKIAIIILVISIYSGILFVTLDNVKIEITEMSSPTSETLYLNTNAGRNTTEYTVTYRTSPITVKQTGIKQEVGDNTKVWYKWDGNDIVFTYNEKEDEKYNIYNFIDN